MLLLKQLRDRILHITRQLDSDCFLTDKQKALLQEELSKLLEKRERYNEYKEKENKEKMARLKW